MPPRLNILSAGRSLAIRSKPSIAARVGRIERSGAALQCRGFAEQQSEKQPGGPNESGIGHITEETIGIEDVKGGTKPDLGQGTPVQEILERTPDGKSKAPKVIKEEINKDNQNNAAQASSTEPSNENTTFAHLLALGQLENIAAGGHGNDVVQVDSVGHKFGLPTLPLPSQNHMKHRYDPLVEQVTNLLMKDGKKSVAQRNMSMILNHLRTSPPPSSNSTRPLVPTTTPLSHLPLDPIAYLTLAIDSVAPLIRVVAQKGAAGGGASLQIPAPLGVRQRRRQAVQWILDVVAKKRSKGSGRGMFAQRFAEEIVGVVEGKSAVWERRQLLHKTGTGARANLNTVMKRR